MNPTILNRDFKHPTDGWYHIEPSGEHRNVDAGVVQVLDDQALASIANRFNAEAAKPNFPGMLIDHEHFRHQSDKETVAYGWLTKIENRADGLYGQVRWTRTGQQAVDGGDYRFFSTEYSPKDLEILNRETPQRVRPLRLSGLTLTNDPNNRGAKPITNRTGDEAEARTNEKPIDSRNQMKSVAQALGLAPEASEHAVLDAVQVLNRRATTAEADVARVNTENTQLQGRIADIDKARVNDALSVFESEPIKNRVTDQDKATYRGLLETNYIFGKAALDRYVAALQPQASPHAAAPRQPITNRATTPAGNASGLSSDDKAVLLNRKAVEYRALHKVHFAEAFKAACEANPDLVEPIERPVAR